MHTCFDINKIPIEILDNNWKRYHPYLFTIHHRHPFANRVIEFAELDKELQFLRETIVKTFPICVDQFKIINDEQGCIAAILVACYDDNEEIIEMIMGWKGFIRINSTNNAVLIDPKGRKWNEIRFGRKTRN